MHTATHEGQFHLVLDLLDVEGATVIDPADEGVDDLPGQPLHDLVDAPGRGGGTAFDGQERLGQGDGDLGRIERRHGAVAADDPVAGLRSP